MTLLVILLVTIGIAALVGVRGIHTVPPGRIGVVVKNYGRRRPGDNSHVSVFGAPGPQLTTLRPNTMYWLPPFLYRVTYVPLTHVPNGTFGLVIARAGATRPSGQALARYVDCDHFSDGARFLLDGGEQGRQQEMLTAGSYEVNPELFDVLTVDRPDALAREGLTAADLREVEIPVGEVGVVVTHVGARPSEQGVGPLIKGHESFQLPWVFRHNGGQLGVQQETLAQSGRYSINPWFAHVIRIPTRVLILEWSRPAEKPQRNLDSVLDQIVLDVQGHTIRFDMQQTIQIPAETAPHLVQRFGEGTDPADLTPVRRFVEKELATTVAAYFRRISAYYTFRDFIAQFDLVRTELADTIRASLQASGIVAIATTLSEITTDEPEINIIRRQIVVQQERVQLEEARLEELNARLAGESVRAEVDLQRAKVDEERRELAAIELAVLVEVLGTDQVALRQALTGVNVPQVVGTADASSLHAALQTVPLVKIRQLLSETPRSPQLDQAAAQLEAVYQRNVNGERHIIQALVDDEHPDRPDVRVVPVSIYLASGVNVGTVEAAVVDLLDEAGIDITESKPPIVGSWFGLRIGRFKRLLTAEEASEAVIRIERTLQARLLDLPQAEIDAKQADAVSKLVTALADQPNACIQVGSLFLIKVDGVPIVRNLSPREMSFLGRNPTVLQDPAKVLNALENLAHRPTPVAELPASALEADNDISDRTDFT